MNKKLMFGAVAALALPLVSCQEEVEGVRTGMVDYTISAGLPTALGTYASNQGGLHNVNEGEYDLKYTMEVWKGNEKVYTATQTKETGFAESVNFNVRLAATQYDFVFFAEFVKEGTEESLYTHSDLNNIVMNDRVYGDESADAYFANVDIDLSQASVAKSVTLKRKMGKIRLLATDVVANTNEVAPTTAKITYVNETVPTTFNALTGEVSGSIANAEFTYTVPVAKEEINGQDAYVIGLDYILPSAEQTAYAFNVQVLDAAGNQIGYREVSNIPVVENKLTTVFGNFFSNEGDLTVNVDDEFENTEDIELYQPVADKVVDGETGKVYETIAEALEAASASEETILVLAASEYNETINDALIGARSARFIGVDGTRIKGLYANNGQYSFENVEFYGAGDHSTGSTVYVGKNAEVVLKNCDIIVEEQLPSQGRPVETEMSFGGSLLLEGCTVSTNGKASFSYLNPAANEGAIQIINCTFDDVLAAEYYSTMKYAVLVGNTFAKTVEFTAASSENNGLSEASNLYVNTILANNTFNGEHKVVAYINNTVHYFDADVEKGKIYNATTGMSYASIRDAVVTAKAGDVIELAEGEYALNQDIKASNGQYFYLPIEVEGLTIKGKGDAAKVVLYGEQVKPNGGWGEQNTVTVFANNVTLENLTLMPKQAVNKLVEIRGNNFSMINCIATPNTIVAGATAENCGSIYFAGEATGGLVEGCTIKYGTVSFDGLMEGQFNVVNNTFVEGNNNLVFTTPNWTSNDVTTSKLWVNVEGNTFEGFEPVANANPVVRAYYGVFNLKNNNFPTSEAYWKSSQFGSIFVNYNSMVGQVWFRDRTEPKSFAISNDVVEFETHEAPANTWYAWQGRKAAVNMSERSQWEVSATLTLTGEDRPVNKSMWLNIGIDWPIVLFKQEADGTRSWKYWDSVGEGTWVDVPADLNIPTTAGEYTIKTTFNNGTITHFINGTKVASYKLDAAKSAVKEVIFNSYSYGESYKTTWSYPVVK